jgi:hypothetical protein
MGAPHCWPTPASVREGMQSNKLNTHCSKDKGWTETWPSSLRTLWKRRWRHMLFLLLIRSLHPTAYGALQAYPGLQSCLLASATLVHRHGEIGNHLKA